MNSMSIPGKRPRNGLSLTWFLALLSAAIVGGFMLLHDIFAGVLSGEQSTPLRLLSHGWHVLVYFAVIYVVLNWVLQKSLAQPIHEIYVKLYALTKGDLDPLRIHSPIAEVREIAEGINIVASRPERAFAAPVADRLRKELRGMESVIRRAGRELKEEDLKQLLQGMLRAERMLQEDADDAA